MYHEQEDKLSNETKDLCRALSSIKEELEAVDWYQQRIDVCFNKELRAILEHNRDEEKEHAAMLIEWFRRNDQGMEQALNKYLFTTRKLG